MHIYKPEPYTGEGHDARDEARVAVSVDLGPGDGAVSRALPDGRVVTVVVQSAEDARSLASAKRARGESSLYAADAKPPAGMVADALVAAGLGVS